MRDNVNTPKMESFKVEATPDGGYQAEARFESTGSSLLAGLAAEILSQPESPNFFVAEVNYTEGEKFERFTISVERWRNNGIGRQLLEAKTQNKALRELIHIAVQMVEQDGWETGTWLHQAKKHLEAS